MPSKCEGSAPSPFDCLPDELLVKIYLELLKLSLREKQFAARLNNGAETDSFRGIRSLVGTCRRFARLARHWLPLEPDWLEARPARLAPDGFKSTESSIIIYRSLIEHLAAVKYFPFTTMSFKLARLRVAERDGDLERVGPLCALNERADLCRLEFDFIVELELMSCVITSTCYVAVVNKLAHLSYLTVKDTQFIPERETPQVLPKQLRELHIICQKSFEDATLFQLFADMSPSLLNFCGTFIAPDEQIKRRFYGPEPVVGFWSELAATMYGFVSFIERQHATLERLCLDCTPLTNKDLLYLVNHVNLQHLHISAMHCRLLSERTMTLIRNNEQLCERVQVSNLPARFVQQQFGLY